jgi:hypothetical protein
MRTGNCRGNEEVVEVQGGEFENGALLLEADQFQAIERKTKALTATQAIDSTITVERVVLKAVEGWIGVGHHQDREA